MYLADIGEARLLEMTIDIGGINPRWFEFAPGFENAESSVWRGATIEVQAVPIKTPGQSGVRGEPVRLRHFLEG